nr:zinc finger, CCHC-type [Tanacetum cinerariifolium]
MHSMGKTLVELHVMLKLYEKGFPNKDETPTVLAIQVVRIQKDKKKLQGAKGKDKGKNKLAYAPKANILPPPKRDNPAKDSICYHCKEVGHWRRNCLSDHDELKKRKNASIGSTSGIFTIELYAFSNKTWVYDRVVELVYGYALETAGRILNMVPTNKGYALETAGRILNMVPTKKEYELGDLNEPPNYKAALEDLESDKWLEAMYTKMQIKSGEAAYILGIKIIRDRSKRLIALSQSAYLEKNLKKFRMENSKKGYTLMMEKPDYR